jgi:membrane-associated protease RseP (regulator of RpoE activity)
MVYAAGPVFNFALGSILFLAIICWSEKLTIVPIAQIETQLAFLIGGLSVAIGLFNLLPFLPLDGGRLLLIAFEAWRGRPVAANHEKHLYWIGASILAGVTIVSVLFLFKVIG